MAEACLTIDKQGAVRFPARLRRKYGLKPGTEVSMIDMGRCIVLTPGPSSTDELVGEIEAQRKAAGLTVKDLLEGLDDVRRQVYEERYGTNR